MTWHTPDEHIKAREIDAYCTLNRLGIRANVLTLHQLLTRPTFILEYRDSGNTYLASCFQYEYDNDESCGVFQMDVDTDNDDCQHRILWDSDYNQTWRCWSQMPTDEEREAATWGYPDWE